MTQVEIHGHSEQPGRRTARRQAQLDWEESLTYARDSLARDGVIAEDALAMLHALGGTVERWRRATRLALTHAANAIHYWPTNARPEGKSQTVEDEVYNNPVTWPLTMRAIELCHAVFETLAGLQVEIDNIARDHKASDDDGCGQGDGAE